MNDDIAMRAWRRTSAVVACAAAALLLLAAAVVAAVTVTRSGGAAADMEAAPAGVPSVVGTSPSAPAIVVPAATGAPTDRGPGGGVPGLQPADLNWTTVAGATVPVSAVAGPADIGQGRARRFTHTPAGAVLAAMHILVRLSPQAGPAVFEPTLTEQVVGPDLAALRDQLEQTYQQARAQLGLPYGEPAGRLYSTVRGYRVDGDDADAVTVRLLIEGPGSAGGSVLVSIRIRMQWVAGDWALVAPPGGDWSSDTAVVTDRADFTDLREG